MSIEKPVPHITLTNVTKRFGAGGPVLEDVSFSVAKGEFVSVVGPSGCGKSTLLKIICGLSPINEGSVLVDGMKPLDAREIVSFIFQDATLLPWRTISQNVELGMELENEARDRRSAKVHSLLELVGLTHVAQAYPRQLSGGMKMRTSIARALATRPRVLLMDEPFAALDEMSRDRLNEELLRIREEQKWTALFVTHSVAEAVFLSTRIIVLAANPGRIAQDVAIDLPFPRSSQIRASRGYDDLVASVSKALRGVHRQ